MSDSVLRKSLPYLLGVIAAGSGVSIKTDSKATTAATNGKVIIFPPLPYTGEELAIYSVGYLLHEAGHLRSTDFTPPPDALSTPLLAMLVNLLEDVRIERLINIALPGARYWLNALTQKFVDTQRQGVSDTEAELTLIMIRYLQDWLFESILEYPAVMGIGERQRNLWRSKAPVGLADAVEAVAVVAAFATSTTEVRVAATEIIRLIEEEATKAQQDATNGDSQESGRGADGGADKAEPGDGAGQLSQPGQTGTPSGPDSTGSQSPDNGGTESNFEAGQGAGAGDAVADDTGPNQGAVKASSKSGQPADRAKYALDLSNMLQTPALQQGADRGDTIKEDMGFVLGTQSLGNESLFTLPMVMPVQQGAGDSLAISAVRSSSTALAYRMEEFLQANTQSRITYGQRGKRLDRDAVRKLAIGDCRIYQNRSTAREIDTAIHVLIDMSGSMFEEQRYTFAISAALAVCMALDDVEGVKYSVSAFPFHGHDVIEIVKTGESVRDVASRFASLVPNGVTPLDKGLMHAHTELMTVAATRRVCLVITDGDPDDIDAAKALVKMGELEGIEHMAIGIACSASHITPNACVVMNIAELPSKVAAMMQTAILLPEAV